MRICWCNIFLYIWVYTYETLSSGLHCFRQAPARSFWPECSSCARRRVSPNHSLGKAVPCPWRCLNDTRVSCCIQGWVDQSILDRTRALLQRARLPVSVPPSMTVDMFTSLMAVDKKVGLFLHSSTAFARSPKSAVRPSSLPNICVMKSSAAIVGKAGFWSPTCQCQTHLPPLH